MSLRIWLLAALMVVFPLLAQSDEPFDAAAAFGARPIFGLSLSPDGTKVAYLNLKMLSSPMTARTRGLLLHGGTVID